MLTMEAGTGYPQIQRIFSYPGLPKYAEKYDVMNQAREKNTPNTMDQVCSSTHRMLIAVEDQLMEKKRRGKINLKLLRLSRLGCENREVLVFLSLHDTLWSTMLVKIHVSGREFSLCVCTEIPTTQNRLFDCIYLQSQIQALLKLFQFIKFGKAETFSFHGDCSYKMECSNSQGFLLKLAV